MIHPWWAEILFGFLFGVGFTLANILIAKLAAK